jgi:hypothetical protein
MMVKGAQMGTRSGMAPGAGLLFQGSASGEDLAVAQGKINRDTAHKPVRKH